MPDQPDPLRARDRALLTEFLELLLQFLQLAAGSLEHLALDIKFLAAHKIQVAEG